MKDYRTLRDPLLNLLQVRPALSQVFEDIEISLPEKVIKSQ